VHCEICCAEFRLDADRQLAGAQLRAQNRSRPCRLQTTATPDDNRNAQFPKAPSGAAENMLKAEEPLTVK